MNICHNCYKSIPDGILTCPDCGASISPLPTKDPDALPPGTPLKNGKYRIGRLLGVGGFAKTYKGSSSGKIYAIKEMWLDNARRAADGKTVIIPYGMKYEEYNECLKKFKEEYNVLSKISHPRIVNEIECFEEHNTAYIVEEFIDGTPLSKYLESKQGKKLQLKEAIELIRKIGEAIDYLHSNHLLHRDIKPDNIILRKPESTLEPVLVDFGIAREFIKGFTKSMTAFYTPGYAPPEQLFGSGRYDERSDVYSLGATLYNLVTGLTPTYDVNEMKSNLSNFPFEIQKIILSCVDPEPNNRPQNVKVLINNLISYTKKIIIPSITQEQIQEIYPSKEITTQAQKEHIIKQITGWLQEQKNSINLSQHLKINSIENRPVYITTHYFLVETREYTLKKEPAIIKQLAPPIVNTKNINVWNYSSPLSPQFTSAFGKIDLISESGWFEPCGACGKAGKEECFDCDGDGFYTCDRLEECDECDGRGSVVIECEACGGWGYEYIRTTIGETTEEIRVDCVHCGGRGRYSHTCHRCNGHGEVPCRKCGGTGQIRCSTCRGSGYLICSTCTGYGFMLNYISITVTNKVEKYSSDPIYDEPTKYSGLDIDKIISSQKYTRIITIEAPYIDYICLQPINFLLKTFQHLHARCQHMRTTCKQLNTSGSKILKEMLTIDRFDVYKCDCELKQIKTVLFLLPDKTIHTQINPVETIWKNSISQLENSLKNLEYKKISTMLPIIVEDFNPRKDEISNLIKNYVSNLLSALDFPSISSLLSICIPYFDPSFCFDILKNQLNEFSKKRNFTCAEDVLALILKLYPSYKDEFEHLCQIIDYHKLLGVYEKAVTSPHFVCTRDTQSTVDSIFKNKYKDKSEFISITKTAISTSIKDKKLQKALDIYNILATSSAKWKHKENEDHIKPIIKEIPKLKKIVFQPIYRSFYNLGVLLSWAIFALVCFLHREYFKNWMEMLEISSYEILPSLFGYVGRVILCYSAISIFTLFVLSKLLPPLSFRYRLKKLRLALFIIFSIVFFLVIDFLLPFLITLKI